MQSSFKQRTFKKITNKLITKKLSINNQNTNQNTNQKYSKNPEINFANADNEGANEATNIHTNFKLVNKIRLNVSTIPLALYIHIPWCVEKCPYCDFNSHTLPVNEQQMLLQGNTQVATKADKSIASDLFDNYVSALIDDINAQKCFIQGREISSIFIGGGTPSLLPIAQYQRLFKHLRQSLCFANDIEITLEANPGTLEHAPFEQYLQVGINRLSLGVQSFDNVKLKTLGRIHDANQAISAIDFAKKAGFKRINIDLMHGLPKQTVKEALSDIKIAHQAGASHISWYQLTIEPNTVFYRNTPILPNDENLADIEEQGSELLNNLGYTNYEVSAWVGNDDKPCQHNLNYWQFGDYLAIGAGAHGKISIDSPLIINKCFLNNSNDNKSINNDDVLSKVLEPNVYRFSKTRLPKDYMNYNNLSFKAVVPSSKLLLDKYGKAIINYSHNSINTFPKNVFPKTSSWQAIEVDDISSEFMLNALRLTNGVPISMYNKRTNQDIKIITPILNKLRLQGLLVNDDRYIQTTALGRRYLNQVLHEFI